MADELGPNTEAKGSPQAQPRPARLHATNGDVGVLFYESASVSSPDHFSQDSDVS